MSKNTEFTPEQLEMARQARNAKLKAWRKANPEKVKAAQIRHFLKVAQASERKLEE